MHAATNFPGSGNKAFPRARESLIASGGLRRLCLDYRMVTLNNVTTVVCGPWALGGLVLASGFGQHLQFGRVYYILVDRDAVDWNSALSRI